MSSDRDSISLPEPPPPARAARDAAVEAALRRFDSLADRPKVAAPRRMSWNRHPQLGLAIAASLMVAIGLPAAFMAIRDQGIAPSSAPTPASPSPQLRQPADRVAVTPETMIAPGSIEQRIAAPPGAPPVRWQRNGAETPSAPAPKIGYAAPPPAPPPPPAAPMVAEKSAGESHDLVVTGSRIPQPNISGTSDAMNSLPARSAAEAAGLSREAESVLSPEFRTCFGKDAPLNAESYPCLDREYRRLDKMVAAENAAALARQPNEAARQRLIRDNRAWRRTRFQHCKDEVGDLRGSTATVVNESCEIDALAERVVWLRRQGR